MLAFANSSSFLILPNVGIMVWTLVVFGVSMFVLAKWVFPLINQALDRRAQQINGEITAAEQLRKEADEVLVEYRERLHEARDQAEEIVARAHKAGEAHQKESLETARAERERMLEQTRREIEAETSRAIDEIRREVADLTVVATERLMRKTLTGEDHQRLVQDALEELDFSALSAGER
jgi:F-type H+-transporting ATPase subunit b